MQHIRHNVMSNKATYAILVALSAVAVFAETGFETAEVHIGYRGRKEEVRTVACQRQPDGAWRFHMPTRDIPRDAWYVDVFAIDATMPKGDNVYSVSVGIRSRPACDGCFWQVPDKSRV